METELKHFGVKGMRWGVRRKKKRVSRSEMRRAFRKDKRTVGKVQARANRYNTQVARFQSRTTAGKNVVRGMKLTLVTASSLTFGKYGAASASALASRQFGRAAAQAIIGGAIGSTLLTAANRV